MSQISDAACRKWLGFKYGIITLALIAWAVLAVPANAMAPSGLRASFTLDSIPVAVESPWLPSSRFTVAGATDANQIAYSLAPDNYLGNVSELDVMSIQFGRPSPLAGFPPSTAGAASRYLTQFRQLRAQSGIVVGSAPPLSLFGQRAAGIVSREDSTRAHGNRPTTTIVEWVGEAHSRLWIVRAIQELSVGESPTKFSNQLATLALTDDTPTAPPLQSSTSATPRLPIASSATLSISVGASATSAWFTGSRPVTQGYGCTDLTLEPIDNRFNCGRPDGNNYVHEGIDFGYPSDCYLAQYEVLAGGPGTVDLLYNPGGYAGPPTNGYYPVVHLDTGQFVVLGHVRQILVTSGSRVSAGTLIAYVGNEGASTGCHLHFEVDLTEGVTRSSVDPTPYLTGSPTAAAAVSMHGGTMDVFVKSSGNQIVYEYWTGSAWNGTWASIGAPSAGILAGTGPAAASMTAGTIDVFVVGADRSVYYNFWSDTVGAWYGWVQVPNSCCAADTPAAASLALGTVDVFVRDQYNRIWYQYWTGSAWNGSWLDLGMPSGGALSAPAAASMGGGEITVFAQGSTGQLMENYWYNSIGAWSGWLQVPNSSGLSGAPAAVSMRNSQMDVFGRDAGAAPWYEYWNGSVWSSTLSLGGTFQSPPAAASMDIGQLDVFFVDNSQVSYRYWTDSGGWSTYVAIPQSVP